MAGATLRTSILWSMLHGAQDVSVARLKGLWQQRADAGEIFRATNATKVVARPSFRVVLIHMISYDGRRM